MPSHLPPDSKPCPSRVECFQRSRHGWKPVEAQPYPQEPQPLASAQCPRAVCPGAQVSAPTPTLMTAARGGCVMCAGLLTGAGTGGWAGHRGWPGSSATGHIRLWTQHIPGTRNLTLVPLVPDEAMEIQYCLPDPCSASSCSSKAWFWAAGHLCWEAGCPGEARRLRTPPPGCSGLQEPRAPLSCSGWAGSEVPSGPSLTSVPLQ